MQSVIAFESGTPEQKLAEGAAEKFDYSQVEGALLHDYATAENVFARCAKHHLRKLLGAVTLRELEEGPPSPLWHSSVAVTLTYDGKGLDHARLNDLTYHLASTILPAATGAKAKLVMFGALSTKLQPVGVNLYTFSLRQKWGLDG